jgi:hypothetical protein
MRCATLLVFLMAFASSAGAQHEEVHVADADTLGTFPRVAGSNLEGWKFTLPFDLEGKLNVVVIAFKREQQADVDTWMPFLGKLAAAHPELRVYEIPTLARGYRLMQSFIDGGMRRGIPNAAVRAATITLYIDKAPFKRALRISDENRIHVLLVDRDGRVHWRAEGTFDPARAAELAERLAAR